MRRLSDGVIVFIFLLAIAIYCQQATQITLVNGVSQTPVVNPAEFPNQANDAQLIAVDDDADEIPGLPLVEIGFSVDDLIAFLPLTISNAVLHYTHVKQPEILRL